jgi:hypothetical protein
MKNKNLILPVSGQSSRFPNMMPKYLLKDHLGHFMLTRSMQGISPSGFDRIIIVALLEHEEKYHFTEPLISDMVEVLGVKTEICEVVLLASATNSQAETVRLGIKNSDISGSILIKDCDNCFVLDWSNCKDGNFIAVGNLHNEGEMNAGNKSYVSISEFGVVQNIVEKQVIGNLFCSGAYFFNEIETYISSYEKVKDIDGLYVSHIIYQSIIDGELFFTSEVKDYLDWGTKADWEKYTRTFNTFLVDIDSIFMNDFIFYNHPDSIVKNVKRINNLHNQKNTVIILISSNSNKYREKIEERLRGVGLEYHQLVLEIPNGRRELISGTLDLIDE